MLRPVGLYPQLPSAGSNKPSGTLREKTLGAPVYALAGGELRNAVPLYANINRATRDRTPEGFAANARAAVAQGFRALKAAPFDGFPTEAGEAEKDAFTDWGIAAIEAMQRAVGPAPSILIGCHSFFSVARAVKTAPRLEPQNLGSYEEPVPPQRHDETIRIRQSICQRMTGESLVGMAGLLALFRDKAVDVIMPGVKHCGGLQEGRKIAALEEAFGVHVAPHNPTGPVAMLASAHWCAAMPNFERLEYQWGEAIGARIC